MISLYVNIWISNTNILIIYLNKKFGNMLNGRSTLRWYILKVRNVCLSKIIRFGNNYTHLSRLAIILCYLYLRSTQVLILIDIIVFCNLTNFNQCSYISVIRYIKIVLIFKLIFGFFSFGWWWYAITFCLISIAHIFHVGKCLNAPKWW